MLFFTVAAPTYIPNSAEGTPLSHPCQHLVLLAFYDSHPDKCEETFRCGFGLHFPDG